MYINFGGLQPSLTPQFLRLWLTFSLLVIRYESLFSYEPCNSDELGLEVGDIVIVFEKCDDGWYMGTCERSGEFGAFPGNFVRKLEDLV